MIRVLLLKVEQHGQVAYLGKLDPRKMVKIASKVEMDAVQDAQRPLTESKVNEISKHVSSSGGILPNTLTLATNDNRIDVKPYENIPDLYYMDFPSTKEEFEEYKESIDVMDGQHRLYSFLPEYLLLGEDAKFEIGFLIFIKPLMNVRRKIFVICNEKQDKVSGNLLMWFREKLDMLTEYEKRYFNLIYQMNQNYPLKGRIIMGGEKIKGGFKANQVMDALKNAHINDLAVGGKPLSEERKLKVVCTYLSAWEKVCDFNFATSTAKMAGAAIKMAGFRFMLLLLQPTWERTFKLKEPFTSEFVEDTIKELISQYGVEREQFFKHEDHKSWFMDRTAISNAANVASNIIRNLESSTFDPLAD